MKTIPAGLQAHLDTDTAFLATLWKLTRVDATVLGFTDHDTDLTVSAVTYTAATGYMRTAVKSSADMSADSLDLQGLLDDGAISEDDLRAGKYQGAELLVSLCNYTNLADGVVVLRRGWIGQITITDAGYEAELRGLSDRLQQTIGRVYGRDCDADLGDERCGIDLTLPVWNATGTVATVIDDATFTDPARTETKWIAGKLTWTTGDNAGASMEVKNADGVSEIELWQPMAKPIVIGDTYAIKAGCQKRRLEDCVAIFANAVNFRGFDTIPGVDYVTGNYPDQE